VYGVARHSLGGQVTVGNDGGAVTTVVFSRTGTES
jgi:hypothetical protein